MLLNAVFVEAEPEQVEDLKQLPGVKAVVRMRMRYPHLDRAAGLINAPAAWAALGGIPNAGLGIKIGIIDTGIDQNHPGFIDPALPAQPHVCSGSDCAFTNNKVIVARSYVSRLGAGTGANPAANSRPDDFSPRDRVGHGTAVAMVAGGNTNTGPNGTITGIAPKAYLGNYKVYGTNGINPGATDDVLIQALEDAVTDGMDVVNLSSGGPAFTGPLDTGTACGNPAGVPCDLLAVAYDTAVRNGVVVVVSAGNEGDLGQQTPTLATVSSPSTAPGVISVAASTNSHYFLNGIFVTGNQVPTPLASIAAEFGDGPLPDSPLTAPLVDTTAAGNTQGCTAFAANSLQGRVAIIARGGSNCTFALKVQNAQAAGAVGVIFTLLNATDQIFIPGGLTGTSIPSVLIGQTDGQTLRSYVASNPNASVTLDFNYLVSREDTPDQIASFSSRGPAFNGGAVKPELTAVGTDVYMAGERIDPSGDLYSSNGYTAASGTSFSSPMTAGAAALVKQKHPGWTTAQIRSALINTTVANVLTDGSSKAAITAQGSGKLDVAAAVNAAVSLNPPTVFFGALSTANPPRAVSVQVTNNGTTPLTMTASAAAPLIISGGALAIQPGQSANLSLSLPTALPPAGSYAGQVTFAGAPGVLHLPYTYIVGDGVPYNAVILTGDGGTGNVGDVIPDGALAFQITDQYGAPVANQAVRWTATRGGAISQPDLVTDAFGIAEAVATLGPTPGINLYTGQAGGLTVQFQDDARARPTLAPSGVVNAASSQLGPGIVPGSYITLYGSNLSDATIVASGSTLPLALGDVSVSFDTPTLSLPGRVYYVSAGQVNVQVPWELAGQTSVQIKVSIDQASGTVVTVPVASVSPAAFVYGQNQAAALDENGLLVGTANPVRRGHIISFFANALGTVSNQPATGEPAPSTPLAQTTATPTVTVGGVLAAVQFSGLAPGFTGLYQVNVVVPANAPTGSDAVSLTLGGVTAPAFQIAVQ